MCLTPSSVRSWSVQPWHPGRLAPAIEPANYSKAIDPKHTSPHHYMLSAGSTTNSQAASLSVYIPAVNRLPEPCLIFIKDDNSRPNQAFTWSLTPSEFELEQERKKKKRQRCCGYVQLSSAQRRWIYVYMVGSFSRSSLSGVWKSWNLVVINKKYSSLKELRAGCQSWPDEEFLSKISALSSSWSLDGLAQFPNSIWSYCI